MSDDRAAAKTIPLDLVELFSGIGGMRISLQNATELFNRFNSNSHLNVNYVLRHVLSIDTSRVVNHCYRYNFTRTVQGKTSKLKKKVEVGRKDEEQNEKVKRQKMDNFEMLPAAVARDYNRLEVLKQANIESINIEELDGMGNVWTMSPPCQPFTTTDQAKQLGSGDPRNKAFAYIMDLLPKLRKPPLFIFFENVKGFENSEVHRQWFECLKKSNYHITQYKLSPLAHGIPMNRTRFYLVACLKQAGAELSATEQQFETTPVNAAIESCQCPDATKYVIPDYKCLDSSTFEAKPGSDVTSSVDRVLSEATMEAHLDLPSLPAAVSGPSSALPLHFFTQEMEDIYMNYGQSLVDEKLLLSDTILKKRYAPGLSIVGADDRLTFCFTSSYGQRMHKSSGSLYHTHISRGKLVDKAAEKMPSYHGKIRLFTPTELLRLFGFPTWYKMPPVTPPLKEKKEDGFTLRHQWRVIGQAISVTVVEKIMHKTLCDYLSQVEGYGDAQTR